MIAVLLTLYQNGKWYTWCITAHQPGEQKVRSLRDMDLGRADVSGDLRMRGERGRGPSHAALGGIKHRTTLYCV
jgi:hypothetical protein